MRAPLRAALHTLALAALPFCALQLLVRAAITDRATPYRARLPYKIDESVLDYPYGSVLGLSFLFFEAQRSGKISELPDGGNRISWRGDQLLDDGDDVGIDLSDRLKITLPTAFSLSRLAWSCLYYHDVYAGLTFQGRSLLFWCKREVKWGAYWLLKTHVPGESGGRSTEWGDDDQFVIMVGTISEEWGEGAPGDFDCYKRAENMPAQPNCPASARTTLLADSEKPAADAASETSAALIAAAGLLDYPDFANLAVQSSHALYDFAVTYNESAVEREWLVNKTYPTTNPQMNILWASSVLAWIHGGGCGQEGWPLCAPADARRFRARAEQIWEDPLVQDKMQYQLNNWDSSYTDSAMILDMLTDATEPDNKWREALLRFVDAYVVANGTGGISSSPLGMRTFLDSQWANLRLSTYSSYVAGTLATYDGVSEEEALRARCLARSQMGYVLGDTGESFVVGYGPKFPQQVHHRDSACTLEEDDAGECDRKSSNDRTYKFAVDRPNPYVLAGALVGGPDSGDNFTATREEFHFTEVALDYNAGLSCGLAAMASFPPGFWDVDCSEYVPNYPWAEARANQRRTAVPLGKLPSYITTIDD